MKEEKDVCSLAWGRCEVSCVVSMTENHTDGFRFLCHQFVPSSLPRQESCITRCNACEASEETAGTAIGYGGVRP